MSLRIVFVGSLFFILSLGVPAWGEGVVGTWATDGDKSHVEIAPCGLKFCGIIVWLKEPLDDDGKLRRDDNNPNKFLRDRSIVGLPLLANFVASTEGNAWEDGTIYILEDGKTYSCTLTLLDTETLKVRGYVGLPMFGKTQNWNRVN